MPRQKRRTSKLEKKPHTPNKAPIIVRAALRDQPDYHLYAEALIALVHQLNGYPSGEPPHHGAIASRRQAHAVLIRQPLPSSTGYKRSHQLGNRLIAQLHPHWLKR
jgi:hypothetical protein